MPIYQIRCLDCSSEFEKLMSRVDAEEDLLGETKYVRCIECKSTHVENMVASFGYSFKGGNPSEGRADMLVGQKAKPLKKLVAERKKAKLAAQAQSEENFVLRDQSGYVPASKAAKDYVRGTYNSNPQFAQKLGKSSEGVDLDAKVSSYQGTEEYRQIRANAGK